MGRWDQGKWDVARWDAEASDLFLAKVTDKPPAPRDYRVALQATTRPAFVPLVVRQKSIPPAPRDVYFPPNYRAVLPPAAVLVPFRELVIVIGSYGDEGPSPRRKAGYWPALQATTQPIRVTYLPTPTPRGNYFSVVTPDPRRPDYSRAVESTTHPVGQLIGVVAGGAQVMSALAAQPDQPPPRGADYRIALWSTTSPIWDAQPPTFVALTPPIWFASPLDPLPIVRNYLPTLMSTSGVTRLIGFPPPPPPAPHVCTVTFQDSISSATVTLQPGSSVTVTLSGTPAPSVVVLGGGTTSAVTLLPASPAAPVTLNPNLTCP